MHTGTFGLYGNPGPTTSFTLTDVPQTLEDLFKSEYQQGTYPIAFFITVETQDMRISFDNGGGFHVIGKNNSGRFANKDMVEFARLKNATAGSNSTVVITLEY